MEDNKRPSLANSDILYINRLTNRVYKDGDILETYVKKAKKALPRETIFDIFARILTRCGEERKCLWHLMFDKEEYTKNGLAKALNVVPSPTLS